MTSLYYSYWWCNPTCIKSSEHVDTSHSLTRLRELLCSHLVWDQQMGALWALSHCCTRRPSFWRESGDLCGGWEMAEGPVGSAHLSGESGPQQRSANFGSTLPFFVRRENKLTFFRLNHVILCFLKWNLCWIKKHLVLHFYNSLRV